MWHHRRPLWINRWIIINFPVENRTNLPLSNKEVSFLDRFHFQNELFRWTWSRLHLPTLRFQISQHNMWYQYRPWVWLRGFRLLLRVVAVLLRRGFAHGSEVLSRLLTGYGQFIVLCGSAPTDSNLTMIKLRIYSHWVSASTLSLILEGYHRFIPVPSHRVSAVMLTLLLEMGSRSIPNHQRWRWWSVWTGLKI